MVAGDGSAPTQQTRPPVSASEAGQSVQSVGQLWAELESARRCVEQLRREKVDEWRLARQQSDTALRQLADRLRQERQRVIEQVPTAGASIHMGQGGDRGGHVRTGGHYHECPPQYF